MKNWLVLSDEGEPVLIYGEGALTTQAASEISGERVSLYGRTVAASPDMRPVDS